MVGLPGGKGKRGGYDSLRNGGVPGRVAAAVWRPDLASTLATTQAGLASMKGVRRRVRPARRGCYQHDLVPAATAGWFVCQVCGMGAVCPGCVVHVPGGVPLFACEEHQGLRAVESYGPRLAWTVDKDSRRGGK